MKTNSINNSINNNIGFGMSLKISNVANDVLNETLRNKPDPNSLINSLALKNTFGNISDELCIKGAHSKYKGILGKFFNWNAKKKGLIRLEYRRNDMNLPYDVISKVGNGLYRCDVVPISKDMPAEKFLKDPKVFLKEAGGDILVRSFENAKGNLEKSMIKGALKPPKK